MESPKTTQISETGRWRLQTWLRVNPSAKPKVYRQVFETTSINSVSYWLEIFFSAGIGAIQAGTPAAASAKRMRR